MSFEDRRSRAEVTRLLQQVHGGRSGSAATRRQPAAPVAGAPPLLLTIDPSRSRVTFRVGFCGFTHVEGAFLDFNGTIAYSADLSLASVSAVIKAASIHTKNRLRDRHLRGRDFLDVEQYPEIVFRSTRIRQVGEEYRADGVLEMHGVVQEIEVPFVQVGDPSTGGARGEVEFGAWGALNRADFGVFGRPVIGSSLNPSDAIIGDVVSFVLSVKAVGTP